MKTADGLFWSGGIDVEFHLVARMVQVYRTMKKSGVMVSAHSRSVTVSEAVRATATVDSPRPRLSEIALKPFTSDSITFEMAQTEALYSHPLHPYTEALMSAVPRPDPRADKHRIVLEGEVADPSNPPSGAPLSSTPRTGCPNIRDACSVGFPIVAEANANVGDEP